MRTLVEILARAAFEEMARQAAPNLPTQPRHD